MSIRRVIFVWSALLLLAAQGCDRRPVATAKFQMAAIPQAATGDGRLDDLVNAAIGPLAQYDLKNRRAIEQIVLDLNLDKDLPRSSDGTLTAAGKAALDHKVKTINDAVQFETKRVGDNLWLVTITARDADGGVASKLANRLMDRYIGIIRDAADDAIERELLIAKQQQEKVRLLLLALESSPPTTPPPEHDAQELRKQLALWVSRATLCEDLLPQQIGERALKLSIIERAP